MFNFQSHCVQAFRIFNTWVGDPSKLVLLSAVLDTITEEKLLDLVSSTGTHLLKGLQEIEVCMTFEARTIVRLDLVI
jgi:4-aminobutyrate aminotransferase-like enzyme